MADAVTKEMNLRDLLKKYPESARVFSAYGIGCLGCSMANYETIEQGIIAHGIDINDFMKDLNEFVGAKA
jgi:hybrid cluster-associated redox disulfide protein